MLFLNGRLHCCHELRARHVVYLQVPICTHPQPQHNKTTRRRTTSLENWICFPRRDKKQHINVAITNRGYGSGRYLPVYDYLQALYTSYWPASRCGWPSLAHSLLPGHSPESSAMLWPNPSHWDPPGSATSGQSPQKTSGQKRSTCDREVF